MIPFGHFRDIDDPDAFVWLRGFSRFEGRVAALEAFYLKSDVWIEHRDAANATILDSDDVLLLRTIDHELLSLRKARRPGVDAPDEPTSFLWLSTIRLEEPATADTIKRLKGIARPVLKRASRSDPACFVSDLRRNGFPRLPVRERDNAIVVWALCHALTDIDVCSNILDHIFIPAIAQSVKQVSHFRLPPARGSLLR